MVITRHIIVAILVGTIGIGGALGCSPGEEKRVRKQFTLLAKWVSKDAEETTFAMADKAQNIGRLFAKDCGFEARVISLSGHYGREEITSYAAQARFQFSRLSLRFYDLEIDFPEKGTAETTLTARATGTLKSGERVDEIHELKSVLKRTDDGWLFSDFEVVEVLEK